MKLITLTCEKCGASLEVDTDNLMASCPYCGAKMMVEVDDLQQLLLSKEQTKRDEMKYAHETEMKNIEAEESKWYNKTVIKFFIGFIIVFLVMILIGEVSSYLFFKH